MSKRIKIYDQVCVGPDWAHSILIYTRQSILTAAVRDATKNNTSAALRPIIRRVENALKAKLYVKFKDLTPNRE